MCGNQKNNTSCNCINDILNVILVLQQNACGPDTCLETCDKPMLGCTATVNCNTRPVMIYTCCGNGTPWSMPTTRDAVDCNATGATCSNVFRIEKLDDCCATFRVLAPNPDTTSDNPYVTTDSFFTMDLGCVCAIKCLNDTYIECI